MGYGVWSLIVRKSSRLFGMPPICPRDKPQNPSQPYVRKVYVDKTRDEKQELHNFACQSNGYGVYCQGFNETFEL